MSLLNGLICASIQRGRHRAHHLTTAPAIPFGGDISPGDRAVDCVKGVVQLSTCRNWSSKSVRHTLKAAKAACEQGLSGPSLLKMLMAMVLVGVHLRGCWDDPAFLSWSRDVAGTNHRFWEVGSFTGPSTTAVSQG